MKNKCYICGRELADGTDCCPHFEHIIPNALGGHLTCNTILCEKCGGDYSKGDSCFVALFDCFVHHIEHQMLFDRKHGGVKVKGSYYDGDKKVDIIVDEKAATPKRPIVKEDDDPVKIIANRKVAKQLVEKYKNAGKDVKVIENLYGPLALYFSEEKASFNDYFKEGFIKIAIEYALYKGISREQLNVALTIHDDNSASVNFDNIPVFPFVPMDSFNNVYENHRQVLENNYPSHSIILFNDGLSLWCYIDLFSTFQYYVLLGDNYIGDKLYECYCQPLFAQREQYMYSREELESFDMRDLHIVA